MDVVSAWYLRTTSNFYVSSCIAWVLTQSFSSKTGGHESERGTVTKSLFRMCFPFLLNELFLLLFNFAPFLYP